MTIKELYELAKSHGMENRQLRVSYSCSDDWYDLNAREVDSEDVVFHDQFTEIYIEE